MVKKPFISVPDDKDNFFHSLAPSYCWSYIRRLMIVTTKPAPFINRSYEINGIHSRQTKSRKPPRQITPMPPWCLKCMHNPAIWGYYPHKARSHSTDSKSPFEMPMAITGAAASCTRRRFSVLWNSVSAHETNEANWINDSHFRYEKNLIQYVHCWSQPLEDVLNCLHACSEHQINGGSWAPGCNDLGQL